MTSTFHGFDPDGDVELILRNPNAAFAVWEESLPTALAPDRLDISLLGWGGFGKRNKKKKKKKNSKGGIPSFASLDPGPAPPPAEPEPEHVPEEPIFEEPPHEDATVADDVPILDAASADHDPSDPVSEELPSDQELEVRMRLSSKHLTLASTYFKKMLRSPWKESIASLDSRHIIEESDWDTEAMVILMNIIHGRARSVPRSISLETFAKLAVLVDYYDCCEVVTVFAERWFQNMEPIPKQYCRDLILWLVISWVFSHETYFEAVTKVALQGSEELLPTLSLPIPQSIVETIDQQRQDLVEQIISGLHNLLLYFQQRENCSFACTSMLLGGLTKQMLSHGLLNPKPTRPFPGYSIAGITSIVRDFTSPFWFDEHNRFSSQHSCTLGAFMDPTINSLVDGVEGLKLKDFQP